MPPRGGQELQDHAHDHHRGDEVWGVGDELDGLLEGGAARVVERQRQQDGDGKAGEQVVDAQPQGVAEDAPEAERLGEPHHVLEPDPRTAPDPLYRGEIAERDLSPVHGHVVEDDDVGHRHRDDQVEVPVAQDALAEVGAEPRHGNTRRGGFGMSRLRHEAISLVRELHQRRGRGQRGRCSRRLSTWEREPSALAARGGTRRRTESGEAPGWQGATNEHIGHM